MTLFELEQKNRIINFISFVFLDINVNAEVHKTISDMYQQIKETSDMKSFKEGFNPDGNNLDDCLKKYGIVR